MAANKSFTEQIEALKADVQKLTGEKADLVSKAEANAQIISDLTSERDTLKAQVESAKPILAERDSLKAANAELIAQVETLKASQSDFDAKVEAAAALKAAAVVASQGIDPITNKPAANHPADNKPKTELKGFAKVEASFAKNLKK